jgi:uncharacterized protein YjbK
MLSHFLRAWADSGKLNQCPAGVRGWGDPAVAKGDEEAPRARLRKAKLLERKSTAKFIKRSHYMTQNVEIEFKNMLLKKEYELLLKEFNITQDEIFTQENHYFDTTDFALKTKSSALRIRFKKDFFEMTLKQPLEIGLLETNQPLTRSEAALAIEKGILPEGSIKKMIEDSGIPFSQLSYFGSLKTHRAEKRTEYGLVVLDHSIYLDKEDFELEFEVEDYVNGLDSFKNLLQKYKIPERKTENKILRFYTQKKLIFNQDKD